MNKIWYLDINGVEEGPFSVKEIRRRSDVTLETLAWKEGMTQWLPIRRICELKVIFKEQDKEEKDQENQETKENRDKDQKDEMEDELTGVHDLMVLELKKDPDYFIYFLIIAILLLFYLFIRSSI